MAYFCALLVLPVTAGMVCPGLQAACLPEHLPAQLHFDSDPALPACLCFPAGGLVRRRLAAGLTRSCEVLRRCLEIATGEVAPDTGLLAAASGETSQRIGLDSGLYPQLAPLYAAATAAGQAIQVGGVGWVCGLAPGGLLLVVWLSELSCS